MDQKEIKIEIIEAYRCLNRVQEKDREKRVDFLNNLAEKYTSDNNIDKETAIKELMDHEVTKELFRTIRLKMNGSRAPQLSEVWIPSGSEENGS